MPQLDIAFSNLPAVVFAVDAKGILTLSKGPTTSFGGPRRVSVGKNVFELFSEHPEQLQDLRRALAGETRWCVAKIKQNWWEFKLIPERNEAGVTIGVTGLAVDVTLRKQVESEREKLFVEEQAARIKAEAARKRSEFLAYASTILARALDIESTLDTLADLAVPEFAQWCTIDLVDRGGKLQRLVVRHASFEKQALFHELSEKYFKKFPNKHPLQRIVLNKEPTYLPSVSLEYLNTITVDDRHREILQTLGFTSLIVVPLVARGRTIGAMSFSASPAQPAFTSDDFSLFTELANRAALSIDNAAHYETAQKAVAMRDEFMSIASHELKTPLTALQGYLQLLLLQARDEKLPLPREQLVRMLECTETQSRRMISLISDLMDSTRIGESKLELRFERADFSALCQDVLRRFEASIRNSGCAVSFQCQEPVPGNWDIIRIEQVLTNLLSNALKYGIGKPIEIKIDANEKTVFLRIRDHGIGIPAEAHARIFERFERLVSPREYSGLGLGLYITRQIVAAHGGDIRVESALGGGATFIVELPRAHFRC